MNKSDYEAMTRKELRDYLRINRTDEEAWEIFMQKNDREATKSPLYPAPKSFEEFEKFLEENPEVKARFSG